MTCKIKTAKYINLESGEVPKELIRKHWFVFLMQSFGVLLTGFVVLFFLKEAVSNTNSVSPTIIFIITLILLVLWIGLFTLWTNYYLDIWILTNKRIINIDQISLFHRSVSSMSYEDVQDIVVQKRGIIQEALNYGTLRVQSAGAENRFFIIKGIPKPASIQKAILDNVEILKKL